MVKPAEEGLKAVAEARRPVVTMAVNFIAAVVCIGSVIRKYLMGGERAASDTGEKRQKARRSKGAESSTTRRSKSMVGGVSTSLACISWSWAHDVSKFVVRSESIESIFRRVGPQEPQCAAPGRGAAVARHGKMRCQINNGITQYSARPYARRDFHSYIACVFAIPCLPMRRHPQPQAHNNKRQRTDEMKANAKTDSCSCTNEPKQTVTPDGPIEDEATAREKLEAVDYDPDNLSEETFMKTMKRKRTGPDVKTPLIHFCWKGDMKMVRYLYYRKGASTTAPTPKGYLSHCSWRPFGET